MKYVFLSAFISLLLYLPVQAQNNICGNQDKFINNLIQKLDKSNSLRLALERGKRGDGIHYLWMDEMKKYNIKHASYTFNFEWRENKLLTLILEDITYHPVYYEYDIFIKNEKKLMEIKQSGLEETLKAEALKRARDFIEKILLQESPNESAKGIVYYNLLDDERLPITVTMPEWETIKSK